MIELRTLGALELRGSNGAELRAVLAQPKRLALLVYLALARPRGFHRRDTLLALFWPELDDRRARAALNQALVHLRRSLGAEAVVSRGGEEVGVDPQRLWCDAAALDEALAAGRPEQALELCRGELLPGFHLTEAPEFERWLEEERAALRRRAGEAAWELADREAAAGRAVAAGHYARRAVAVAPLDEAQLRRLMELLERVGDRAGAVAAYEEFARRLREEYELELSAETRALAAGMRTEPASPVQGGTPPGEAAALTRPPAADSRSWYLATAAIVAIGIAVAGWGLRSPERTQLGSGRARDGGVAADVRTATVAILPFEDRTGAEQHDYFASGIHEDILVQLSKIGDLAVISRSSVAKYSATDENLQEIAEQLGATAVLLGSVRRADDEIRLSVQLVDPATGTQLWAETYDRSLNPGSLFRTQSEIARRVAEALGAVLSPEEEARVSRVPTGSLEAYDFYLRGRDAYRLLTDEANERAIRLFRRAVELDPKYAEAWAGLGEAYVQRVNLFGHGWASADSALAAAERAVQLDRESGAAHKALAFAYGLRGWSRSREENLRAFQLDPSNARAANNLGSGMRQRGRYDEALLWYFRALRLDPATRITRSNIAEAYWGLGDTVQARRWYTDDLALTEPDGPQGVAIRAALAQLEDDLAGASELWEGLVNRQPENAAVRVHAAFAAYRARSFERMRQHLAEAFRISPDGMLWARWLYGFALVRTGRVEEGQVRLRRELERLNQEEARGNEFIGVWVDRALIHATLGETEQALAFLEQAYDRGFRAVLKIRMEPGFDPLRHEPRFRALMGRIEADLASMRRRVDAWRAAGPADWEPRARAPGAAGG